ncbi:RNA ligase, variant 2 [Balamuthia mandrillaris]
MVSPYYTEGQLRFCTKQGVTDASLLAEAFINAEPEDQGDRKKSLYKEFSAEWIERGYTPIYEWCSNKTRVVLDYPTDSLTLVCLRHMHSGDYLSYAETKKVAEEYGIPVVKAYTLEELGVYLPSSASERQEGEGGLSLAELQHAIREKNQGFEGFVIRFDSGLMYKIKTKWYCNINKALELVSSARSNAGSERSCWKCILEEKYDDLRAWLVEEDRRAMDEFSSRMVEEIDKNCAEMLQQVTELKQLYNNDRAKFARSLSSQPSSSSASVRKPILFKIWQQLDEEAKEVTVQDIRPWVVTMFLQGMAKRSTFEALRNALASGISYQTFLDKHWADKPKPTPNLDQ